MASSRRPGTNEAITTFGASGYGRDYTALQTWEDATDIDCVAGTTSPVLECHKDAASYSITSACECLGGTYSASYHRIVRAASTARHLGVPGAGVVFAQTGYYLVLGDQHYMQWSDLELVGQANQSFPSGGLNDYYGYSPGLHVEVVGCLLSGSNTGSGTGNGLNFETSAGNQNFIRIVNCVAYGCDDAGFACKCYSSSIYACTSVGNGAYGLIAPIEPTYKNCVATGNGTAAWNTAGGDTGTTHNLSSDATAPGTVTYRDKTLTFVDAANGDCRLVASDTDAIDKGTDLSGDATFPFDDDIAFTTRPAGAWDLGAFEYVAAASTVKHFVSRW